MSDVPTTVATQPGSQPPTQSANGGDVRRRVIRHYLPLAATGAIALVVFMNVPFFDANDQSPVAQPDIFEEGISGAWPSGELFNPFEFDPGTDQPPPHAPGDPGASPTQPDESETGSPPMQGSPGQTGGPQTEHGPGPAGGPPSGAITVYSGRGEEIVGPVIERFQARTGIEVNVRYGTPPELETAILQDDENAPVDVYIGPGPGGVLSAGDRSALSAAGRLQQLPDQILSRVNEEFSSPRGEWVGVTGRARVLVYNTDRVSADELPDSIRGFTDPVWDGRLGWAPTNGSFQSWITRLRAIEGDAGARDWLTGVQANRPKVYDDNEPIVDAVAAGEIDAGFVNSYYLLQARSTGSIGDNVAGKYYTAGDPGASVEVSIGAALLDASRNVPAAGSFIEFLLQDESQQDLAEAFELPLVDGALDGVHVSDEFPDLASLRQPTIQTNRLEDLDGTRGLLAEVGVLRQDETAMQHDAGRPGAPATQDSGAQAGDQQQHAGDLETVLRMRKLSFATGYIATGLLGLTLLIGPANLLLRRRTPLSSYLRRDVGIAAAIGMVAHVVFGLLVKHADGTILSYFFAPGDRSRVLTSSFGLANWAGLLAVIIAVTLLVVSSDAALRKLRARRWKRIQRLNYVLFALVIVHAVLYGALWRTTSPYTIILGLVLIAVLTGQAIGVRLWRRRQARIPARATA